MNKWFDEQSQVVRIVLLIPIWGWVFAALYRIFTYVNSSEKNVVTLVAGILCIIPVVGFVLSVLDLVTTITQNKITFLAE